MSESGTQPHPDIFTPDEAAVSSMCCRNVGQVYARKRLVLKGFMKILESGRDTISEADDGSSARNTTPLSRSDGMSDSLLSVPAQTVNPYPRRRRVRMDNHSKLLRARRLNGILRRKLAAGFVGCNDVPDCLSLIAEKLHRFGDTIHAPPCVYFLIDAGVLIYIGQTIDLLSRIGAHYGGGAGKCFDSAFYIPVRIEDLTETEYAFIRFFKPPQNGTCPETLDHEMLCRRYGLK